jgi:iron complex outermembrane receptor protein
MDAGLKISGRRARNHAVDFIGVDVLVLLWTVLQIAPAFAQASASPAAHASPAPAAAPQVPAPPTGVEEIVVTAQKREQLSQDVPIALTAITAANLQFRGIDDLSDLQMQVPGMAFATDAGGGQQIYIRGIGVDDGTADIESPIATYIDGVYQTRTFRTPTLGIDLDRVEVLKGPQGTLFGRNATGGAVNIILQPPSDELTGTLKVGGGSYGQVLTEGAVSGPLIKHILDFRVSGAFNRNDGWIINDITGRPVNGRVEGDGRVALSFRPLDNLSFDYDLLASKEVGGDNPVTNIQFGTPAMQKAAGIPVVIPPSDYLNGNNPWKGKFNYPITGDKENTQNSLTAKWDIAPSVSLKSITAFQEHTNGSGQRYSGAGIAYPLINFDGHPVDDKYFSQELNLLGTNQIGRLWNTDQPLTWILGAYYGHEDFADFFTSYKLFHGELDGAAGGREKLNDYSVFGDTTIPLPWNFSLFGGVRYTYDRKALNQTVSLKFSEAGPPNFGPPYTPPLNIPGSTCYGVKYVDSAHNLSPRVGMGWAPNETVNFYVKYSEGYNAGGHYYNGCNNGYKPETNDSIEGGVKGRWFDGRLALDAAGYYNDFKNFQFFQVVDRSGALATAATNIPGAKTYGAEFQLTAIPFENFTANFGLSIMHSEYEDFHDADIINPSAGNQNLSGNQITRSPNSTEQVGLEYDWQVPWNRVLPDPTSRFLNLGALRLRGEWFHTDYIIFAPFGKTGFYGANDVQNPYSIFNFYASLPAQDDRWTLRFFAKNFTNTKYYTYKSSAPWQWSGVGGNPPWFGGDLTYHF